ncbi:hypothetical protein [Streptomyces sp. CNQ-509]|nr:hypothetical protein [Streptomyces sp. CNQ-509]
MTLATAGETDRQTERVVEALLTGLAQEPGGTWPAPRSTHTERRARGRA